MSRIRVRVEDQGPGMSAQVIEKIFDPFFTTKGEGGTGLGLVQVHATMNLVGGYVTVTSEPERGTVVDLMFPAADTVGVEGLSTVREDEAAQPPAADGKTCI